MPALLDRLFSIIDELCKSWFLSGLISFLIYIFLIKTDHGIGKCFPSDSHQLNLVRPFSASANLLRNKIYYSLLVFKSSPSLWALETNLVTSRSVSSSYCFPVVLEWQGDCFERFWWRVTCNCLRDRSKGCCKAVAYAGNLLTVLCLVHLNSLIY